ncbi:MAG: hypothetical protein QM661_08500 [Solimonas sp.]
MLAIVATQFVAIVHASQHELSTPDDAHCELCAIAHAAPLPPAAAALPAPTRYAVTRSVARIRSLADRRPFARPNSRAPPAFSA